MCKWLDKTTALVLSSALVLAACGDDDESTPVEPEPEPVAEITPEIVGLYGTLVSSFTNVFFAVAVGQTSVEGGGRWLGGNRGQPMDVADFSPDGELIINGTLNVGATEDAHSVDRGGYPVWITGSRNSAQYGDFSGDRRPFCTGDDNINDVEYDVAELSAAAAAAAEAAAAAG